MIRYAKRGVKPGPAGVIPSGSTVVGIAVLVLALLLPSAVFAQSSWYQIGTGPVDSSALTSLSCPTSTFCAAVDSSGHALTGQLGSSQSSTADIDGSNALVSVSCPSSSFCMAVDAAGNAMTYNQGSWSAPASTGASNRLTSVSCASAGFCVAVTTGGSGTDASALTYANGQWSAPTYFNGQVDRFSSVSCAPSTSSCVAVGTNYAGSSGGTAWVYDYSGHSWTAMIHNNASYPNSFDSVSCPSASFCMAVDSAGNATSYSGTWSPLTPIDGSNPLASVSCASASFCAAVDTGTNAVTFNGSWGAPTALNGSVGLAAVSCTQGSNPAPFFCGAVDGGGGLFQYNSGSSYTLAIEVTGKGGATGSVTSIPAGLLCANTVPPSPQVIVVNGNDYCLDSKNPGASFQLIATPDPGYVFFGWNGACSGSRPKCDVTMSADRQSVTATFASCSSLGAAACAQLLRQQLTSVIVGHGPYCIPCLVHTHHYQLSFTSSAPGHLLVSWYYVPRGARVARAAKPVLVAQGQRTFSRPGRAKLKLRLTPQGLKLLRHAKHPRLTAKGTFTARGKRPVKATKSFTL